MPRSWKPSRVFFGWWVVGASLLTALYVDVAVFYGFTTVFGLIMGINILGGLTGPPLAG